MSCYLGIDTSNYTTSAALYDSAADAIYQQRRLLSVGEGSLGLRQSDAVFLHTKQLAEQIEHIFAQTGRRELSGVGVSYAPRDAEGSYMPCFLVGEMAGRSVAAAVGAPVYRFSHQAGHVMAAVYSANRLDLVSKEFLAFHVSGGTTECLLVVPDRERCFQIRPVARSLDLHAGQAVDRVGALLGLGFPAGPALEELALTAKKEYRPKPTLKGVDCCLSGVENQCKKLLDQGEAREDVAAYLFAFLRETLCAMAQGVAQAHPGLPMVFAGGVMSNTLLREALEKRFSPCFAAPGFSADNAAGTAVLAAWRHRGGVW